MISIQDLVENGKEWNHQWIKEVDPNHYLFEMASYWNHPNIHNEFIETCCEITAEMIAEKLGVHHWNLFRGSFEELLRRSPLFRISIGVDCADIDHILTVWNNWIVHSFFRHYPLKAVPLTEEIIAAFDSLNYDIIAGFPITEDVLSSPNKHLKVFYWIPT